MGESERDKAVKRTYEEIGNINPTVQNLFAGYRSPYSAEDIMSFIDSYTNKAIGDITKRTETGVNRARKDVGRRLLGSGITGGALFEDALATAENRVRIPASEQIEDITTHSIGLKPGILERENVRDFQRTGMSQNVLFRNLENVFRKYGMRGNIANLLDDDTFGSDLLAVLNTAGNIGQGIAPFI